MHVQFRTRRKFAHGSKASRHRDRIARKRARLVNAAERRNLLHHVEAAAISAHRHAAADNLPEGRQIGLDAVQTLRAVDAHAESRHDLVHNQERAMLLGLCGKRLQELGLRGNDAHVAGHRFNDDARNLVADLVEKFFNARHVVVLERKRVLREVGRHSLAAWLARGEHARARLDKQAIAVAMVAAFKLHNLVAPSKTASRTNGAHRCLGPAVHHANHLHTRHEAHHKLREFGFEPARSPETETVLRRLGNRLDNGIVSMAQEHRPPTAYIIDVVVTIHIVDVTALRAGDKRRCGPHVAISTHRAVHTTRHECFGFGKKFFAKRMIHVLKNRKSGPKVGFSLKITLGNSD